MRFFWVDHLTPDHQDSAEIIMLDTWVYTLQMGVGNRSTKQSQKVTKKPISGLYTKDRVEAQSKRYDDVSSLNSFITRRNHRASDDRVPQVRPVPTFLDDCTSSTVKAKALDAAAECKYATQRVQHLTNETDEIDKHISELVRRIPEVYEMWSSNPRGAQELLARLDPKTYQEIEDALDRINTLRSTAEIIVTPFRDKLHCIRNEVLQCYNKQCAKSDPSTLGRHIPSECVDILDTVRSIDKQLEGECTVFNLRANDVTNYYQNTKEMDETHSNMNNKPVLGRLPRLAADALLWKGVFT